MFQTNPNDVVILPSWWFFTNPFEKYAKVKLDHETPRFRGVNKKCFKPPPRYWLFNRDPYVMVYDNPHITG